MKNISWIAAVLTLITLPASSNSADGLGDAIRATADKYRSCCVNVSVAMSMSAEGETMNNELEVPGVVIDASGLIVIPNYAIDPGQDAGETRTKITGLKIVTVAGVETVGKVVLRDPDKNLAFIRPVKPLDNVTAVSFGTAPASQLGDLLFVLGDLGKIGNRAARVTTERIVGVIEKPRKVLVLAPTPAPPFGNAAFNEKGEPVGFVTVKTGQRTDKKLSMNSYDQMLLVVVPGDEVMEVAKQAPQIKDIKPGSKI